MAVQFDLSKLDPMDCYKLLAGLIVPRPIALVTSVAADGKRNAAPFSFFNMFGHEPPIIALGIENRDSTTPKDTKQNIRDSGEFVVNVVDEVTAEQMNICAIDFPTGEDELSLARFTSAPALLINGSLIVESPASLECRLTQEIMINQDGKRSIFLGEVLLVHVREGIVDERMHVDQAQLNLIGRTAGDNYVRTRDRFQMPRIRYHNYSTPAASAKPLIGRKEQ